MVFLDGTNTYSDPKKVGYKMVTTAGGVVRQTVDRTSIDFNNRGELIIPSTNKELIEFLREHELCRGSLANRESRKLPRFFEHDAVKIFETNVLAIENLATVVSYIKGLGFEELVSYTKQFSLPILAPEKMTHQNLKMALILAAQKDPAKFLIPETQELAPVIQDIKSWQKAKIITWYNGGRGKNGVPYWKWNAIHQPEGVEEAIIVELNTGDDKYMAFAKFLQENDEVYALLEQAAS